MTEDLRRLKQLSVRLNKPELQQLEDLVGYRGLWELSDLLRAGLQLLLQAENEDFKAGGETGALKRRNEIKRKGRK